MRITIGHILILASVGGVVALNFSKRPDMAMLEDKYTSVISNVGSLMDLFKSGAGASPAIPVPTPAVETKPAESENVLDLSKSTDAVPEPVKPAPVAPATPTIRPVEATKTIVEPDPLHKGSFRTRKTRKITKGRVKKTTVAAATSKDPLIGSYVTLTLDSGREVKGILEERTATFYKIELPGMGPFTYQANKVISIKPSK